MKIKEWIEEHPVVASAAAMAAGLTVGILGGKRATIRRYEKDLKNTSIFRFEQKFIDELAERRGWTTDYARKMIQNTAYLEFLLGHEVQTQGIVNFDFVRTIANKRGIGEYIAVTKD